MNLYSHEQSANVTELTILKESEQLIVYSIKYNYVLLIYCIFFYKKYVFITCAIGLETLKRKKNGKTERHEYQKWEKPNKPYKKGFNFISAWCPPLRRVRERGKLFILKNKGDKLVFKHKLEV